MANTEDTDQSTPPTLPDDPIALLELVIKRSGLSNRRWAETIAWRDERTIRRWIAREIEIPEVVRRNLRRIVEGHPSDVEPTTSAGEPTA